MTQLKDPGAGEKDRATRKKKRMKAWKKLAHATIYSRALTQAEITQNYNYLKGYLRRERGISLS